MFTGGTIWILTHGHICLTVYHRWPLLGDHVVALRWIMLGFVQIQLTFWIPFSELS